MDEAYLSTAWKKSEIQDCLKETDCFSIAASSFERDSKSRLRCETRMTMDVFFSLAAACSDLISRNQMIITYPHEEQVFIATAKGRNGPERPLHPNTCDKGKVPTIPVFFLNGCMDS